MKSGNVTITGAIDKVSTTSSCMGFRLGKKASEKEKLMSACVIATGTSLFKHQYPKKESNKYRKDHLNQYLTGIIILGQI